MILNQHGINAQGGATPGEVVIDGRTYHTVTIGSRVWLVENLQYEWAGLDVSTVDNPIAGTPNTPTAWYYNNNKATYGLDGTKPCGLLYNGFALEYLINHPELLPDGWRVPNQADATALTTAANSDSTHLKCLDNAYASWPINWDGDDSLGLSMVPNGFRNGSGVFTGLDTTGSMWNSYIVNVNYHMFYVRDFNTTISMAETSSLAATGIRLVRDA